MTLPWTKDAKEAAKRHGRYLVKLQLQGKYAGRGNVDFAGDVSDDVARKLQAILAEIVVDVVQNNTFERGES